MPRTPTLRSLSLDRRCGATPTVMSNVPEAILLEIDHAEDIPASLEDVSRLVEERGGRWILKASTGNAGEDLLVFDGA